MAFDPSLLNDAQILEGLLDIAFLALDNDVRDLSTLPLDRRPCLHAIETIEAWRDHAARLRDVMRATPHTK